MTIKFNGKWKGKGNIISLNIVTKQTTSSKAIIEMEIIQKSCDIYVLTGKIIDKNNSVITYDIIGYYNPNTKCIETSEKSGDGITSTFIKDNKLYHRASVCKNESEPKVSFAASFKLKKF